MILCQKKSATREWLEAITIAFFIIIFIRGCVFDLFTIPSSSMEKTLLVGDYILVSKLHYGARTPITPLALPIFHQRIPHTAIPSFLNWIQLGYHRLPGFSEIKHNDIVVFNYPMELDYPIDERTYFVKRCIGFPGDTLEIKNHTVFLNGVSIDFPKEAELQYQVETNGDSLSQSLMNSLTLSEGGPINKPNTFLLSLTNHDAEDLKINKCIKSINVISHPFSPHDFIFPYDKRFAWNIDIFGPIYVPQKGDSISLSLENLSLFKKIIEDDDHNTIAVVGKEIHINDKLSQFYTFKMNYYFMMGDNRHHSADSRYWGFVPESHIVGKAVMVLGSLGNEGGFFERIRWNRIFSFIN